MRALYRVFVAPAVLTPVAVPLFYAPAFAASLQGSHCTSNFNSRISIRTKKYSKDTRRHALTDYYVLDAAIQAERINFVDDQGTFHAGVQLNEVLTTMNKTTHHVVQVTPGKVDELGRSDIANPPTCRLVSKMDLRAQHERKLDTMRRQARHSAGALTKNMELNWAIAGGDLKHRLQKLAEFLREGRKVEVLLGPKRKGKKATVDEANHVMEAVQDAVAECRGAREVKREGQVGAILTIVYEGKRMEDKKPDTSLET